MDEWMDGWMSCFESWRVSSEDLPCADFNPPGNGATAAQIIPEIVKEVASLTIHQRTPNWVIPRLDAPIAPWKRAMYKWVPPIRQRKRADMMDFRESFYDAVTDGESAFAKMLEGMHKQLAAAQLADKPELREKLEPKYKVGCKRGELA